MVSKLELSGHPQGPPGPRDQTGNLPDPPHPSDLPETPDQKGKNRREFKKKFACPARVVGQHITAAFSNLPISLKTNLL